MPSASASLEPHPEVTEAVDTGRLLWTPSNRAALHAFAAEPPPTHIDKLASPKKKQLARKRHTLMPLPRGSGLNTSLHEHVVPPVDPAARLLSSTIVSSRRALPQFSSEPAIFEASSSRENLPLGAKVSWRSGQAPPWSPMLARERALLEHALNHRNNLAFMYQLETGKLPQVPRTAQRAPKWNSSQLGLYRDWPKGLLVPPDGQLPRAASWGQF